MTRLGRLYKYAKSSSALENFTTEALASAILKDPKPWVAVLHKYDLVSENIAGAQAVVHTQVRRKGADGRELCLDLVVEFPKASAPMWVEVKVNAGEHGNQLERYQALANTLSPPARVVTLARTSEVKPGVLGLSWRDLYEAIDTKSDLYWHELRDFMDEHRMIVSSEDSISDENIAAMQGSLELIDKLTERLHRFTRDAKARGVPVSFPLGLHKIRGVLGGQLGRHRRLCVPSLKGSPSLLAGVWGFGSEGGARLMMCFEHRPSRTELRRKVLGVADDNGLDAAWRRDSQSWAGLLKSVPLDADNSTLEGSVQWWTTALQELQDAKILDYLAGGSAAEEDDEEDEGEG